MDSFSQSLVFPPNLRFWLHRLSDNAQPATNILRVNALNSTNASSGGLVIVRLPMALCDLSTFSMFFETNMTPGTVTIGSGIYPTQGVLPRGIEGLISRLEVSVNGLGLLNLQQYNLLYSILKDSHQGNMKSSARRELQNEIDTAPMNASYQVDYCSDAVSIDVSRAVVLSTSSQSLVLTCTTTTKEPLNLGGGGSSAGSYKLKMYPPAGFFTGVSATTALTSDPTIANISSTATYLTTTTAGATATPAGYVNQFELTYTLASGTWTATTGAVTTTPFSLQAVFDDGRADNTSGAGRTATACLSDVNVYSFGPNQNGYHAIHDWLSFFQAQPKWIQTQMLGEVEVRITLAQNDVLGIQQVVKQVFADGSKNYASSVRPDFSLQNIYFSIRTCSFDNNFLDDMLHSKLSGGGELEIPYPNYFNINQIQSSGQSTQSRFSVNTQSLDRVVAVNRIPNFNSPTAMMAQVPSGYGIKSNDTYGIVHRSPYFATYASYPSGSSYGQSTNAYPPYTGALAPGSFNNFQFQLNNAFIPNYKISPVNEYFLNLEAYGLHNDWNSGTLAGTPAMYLNSQYQMIIPLEFMDPDVKRLISGVDTRGAVSVAYLNQDNNVANDRTDIFTCFTSVLRIGANQQIQVVY